MAVTSETKGRHECVTTCRSRAICNGNHLVCQLHNPNGVTIGAARGCELAEIASRPCRCYLIDDDPYGKCASRPAELSSPHGLVRVGPVPRAFAGIAGRWMAVRQSSTMRR